MTRQSEPPEHTGGARRGFWRHKRGNIALITAFMMIPLTFALGMAFDFTLSQTRKDQLDGIADAAALGAVTPTQMALSCTTAAAQSHTLFNGQEATVTGVSGLSVTVSGCPDTSSSNIVTRAITVSYTGQSQNVFASLLGMPTLPISGHSTATSTTAPNINFYLLLDTSPSMELAATSAGISTMVANTQQEVDGVPGCAFGCHESNPNEGSFNNPSGGQIACQTNGSYADGTNFTTGSYFPVTGRDNYDLSRCLGVTLRIDLLRTAVQNLLNTAGQMETLDNATYNMALYETDTNQSNPNNDFNLYNLSPLTSVPPEPAGSTQSSGALYTAAGTISALEVYQNNYLVYGDENDDLDTALDTDLSSMNTTSVLPTPGNGAAGQQPQEVLFIVTDGLNDTTPSRTYAPLDWSGAICTAIKNRGIRIAVLYTQYLPLTAPGGFYEKEVAPVLPTGLPSGWPANMTPVSPNDPMALGAQQCASPGLFYEVTTDGDISAALQTLFQEAVQTARLLH